MTKAERKQARAQLTQEAMGAISVDVRLCSTNRQLKAMARTMVDQMLAGKDVFFHRGVPWMKPRTAKEREFHQMVDHTKTLIASLPSLGMTETK